MKDKMFAYLSHGFGDKATKKKNLFYGRIYLQSRVGQSGHF